MRKFLTFGFPFLFRIMIPGAVGAVIFTPLIFLICTAYSIELKSLGTSPPILFLNIGIVFTMLSFFLGLCCYFLDDFIYTVFGGFKWWPNFLRRFCINQLNKKIKEKLTKAREQNDEVIVSKLWNWLMRFPIQEKAENNDVEVKAVLPTQLGNIIQAYEDYPESRYGMSSVFYWARLWLTVDAETRKEINTIWATADCLIYISFSLMWGLVLYFFTAVYQFLLILFERYLCSIIGYPYQFDIPKACIVSLIVWIFLLTASRLFYLISLPLHMANGDFYRSLFDIHRNKLLPLTKYTESERHMWDATWRYLKYKHRNRNDFFIVENSGS